MDEFDDVVDDDVEALGRTLEEEIDEDDEWRREGSPYLEMRVRRVDAEGAVIGWLSAEESDFTDANGPAPLYRVKYDSGRLCGEIEDLEEHELVEALCDKSEYERLREENMQRNKATLEALGLVTEKAARKRPRKEKEGPSRRSPRLQEKEKPEDPIDEVDLADELDTLAKNSSAIVVEAAKSKKKDIGDAWSTVDAPSASDILAIIADYENSRRERRLSTPVA